MRQTQIFMQSIYLGRGREEGTGEGMFELSNSQTLHTRTTERRKHEATPTASALSCGLPLVICFTIVDRILLRVCAERERE